MFSMSFCNCNIDFAKWTLSAECHIELAWGETGDGRCIAARLVTANENLVGKRER
jgi:hypothetical protein